MWYTVSAYDATGREIGTTNSGSQRKTLESVARTRLTDDGAVRVDLKAQMGGVTLLYKSVRTVREAVAFFNNHIS